MGFVIKAVLLGAFLLSTHVVHAKAHSAGAAGCNTLDPNGPCINLNSPSAERRKEEIKSGSLCSKMAQANSSNQVTTLTTNGPLKARGRGSVE